MTQLAPEIELQLAKFAQFAGGPEPPLEILRAALVRSENADLRASGMTPAHVAAVTDHEVPVADGATIGMRLFVPDARAPHPVYVHFHGGAFRLGTIYSDLNDARCRHWSAAAGCAVLTVEYRLAPEHPFPTPAEDCYAALLWVAEHATELGLDGSRIAVGGDSAGANLATVVSLMARDRGGPSLVLQILEIPCVDLTDADYPSAAEFGTGFGLTPDMMATANADYLRSEADASNPYASPILADLTGLPAALVLTAELDILRDSGEAYARRLDEAGVPTTLRRHTGHIHGAANLFHSWAPARVWMDEIGEALRAAYSADRS